MLKNGCFGIVMKFFKDIFGEVEMIVVVVFIVDEFINCKVENICYYMVENGWLDYD